MRTQESTGKRLTKLLLLLIAIGWLLFFALLMGTFATGAPGSTPTGRWISFLIVFGLFALPAFWPLRAFCRTVRALAQEVHRDDSQA